MKRLSITQLVPGMTVAEDVYDLDHELLIQKGTILTDKLITKLDLYGILTIFVEDIIQPVRPAEDSTDTELSYSERIKSSPEFQLFKTDFENDVELFRENMNLVIQKNTSLDVNTLLKNTMAIVANHSGSISILDMLQNMREYDDSTYTHSLNVALICNILAGWLKLSDEEIELATACGLFHDIGKLLIPYSIISKPGKLSEEEFATIKKHPTCTGRVVYRQDAPDPRTFCMGRASLAGRPEIRKRSSQSNPEANLRNRQTTTACMADPPEGRRLWHFTDRRHHLSAAGGFSEAAFYGRNTALNRRTKSLAAAVDCTQPYCRLFIL